MQEGEKNIIGKAGKSEKQKKMGGKANSFKRSELYNLSLCGDWKLRERRMLQSFVSNVVAMKDDEGKRKNR